MRLGAVLGIALAFGVAAGCGGGNRAASCRVEQMSVALGPLVSEKKTEQHTATVVLTNRFSRSCSLRSYPTIALLDEQAQGIPFVYRQGGDQMITRARPTTVVVRGGGSAFFGFNKNGCVARPSRIARTLRVALPSSAGSLSVRLQHYPTIDYCGTGFFAVVTVSPIERRRADVFPSQ
jgi:Protein of unknown function (DUF4232)